MDVEQYSDANAWIGDELAILIIDVPTSPEPPGPSWNDNADSPRNISVDGDWFTRQLDLCTKGFTAAEVQMIFRPALVSSACWERLGINRWVQLAAPGEPTAAPGSSHHLQGPASWRVAWHRSVGGHQGRTVCMIGRKPTRFVGRFVWITGVRVKSCLSLYPAPRI